MSEQQLRDRIVELERALTPFANYAAVLLVNGLDGDRVHVATDGRVLTYGHFGRAAEALKVRP